NASVNWPVGIGGKGNEAVSALVRQTAGSIGYAGLTFAMQNNISYGLGRNLAGTFVQPSIASVSVAPEAAAAGMPNDFRITITNSSVRDAYPIASFTWLLIPSRIGNATKRNSLLDFLKWMLSDGQAMAAPLSYAKLPASVIARETQAIARVH